MGRINAGRVVLGGLLAGLVITVSEYILNEVVLKSQWEAAMHAINLNPPGGSAIPIFTIANFVGGILAVWLYAAVRPRLGPGPKTAAIVGVVVWVFTCVMAMLPPLLIGIIPGQIVGTMYAWCLVEAIVATVLGASVYKEA